MLWQPPGTLTACLQLYGRPASKRSVAAALGTPPKPAVGAVGAAGRRRGAPPLTQRPQPAFCVALAARRGARPSFFLCSHRHGRHSARATTAAATRRGPPPPPPLGAGHGGYAGQETAEGDRQSTEKRVAPSPVLARAGSVHKICCSTGDGGSRRAPTPAPALCSPPHPRPSTRDWRSGGRERRGRPPIDDALGRGRALR